MSGHVVTYDEALDEMYAWARCSCGESSGNQPGPVLENMDRLESWAAGHIEAAEQLAGEDTADHDAWTDPDDCPACRWASSVDTAGYPPEFWFDSERP